MDTANIGRKPVAAIDEGSIRVVEVTLAPRQPPIVANDDREAAPPRAVRDSDATPRTQPALDLQARLEAAGDQVVRLLAQLAAVDPAGASAWVERHAAAIGRSVA